MKTLLEFVVKHKLQNKKYEVYSPVMGNPPKRSHSGYIKIDNIDDLKKIQNKYDIDHVQGVIDYINNDVPVYFTIHAGTDTCTWSSAKFKDFESIKTYITLDEFNQKYWKQQHWAI